MDRQRMLKKIIISITLIILLATLTTQAYAQGQADQHRPEDWNAIITTNGPDISTRGGNLSIRPFYEETPGNRQYINQRNTINYENDFNRQENNKIKWTIRFNNNRNLNEIKYLIENAQELKPYRYGNMQRYVDFSDAKQAGYTITNTQEGKNTIVTISGFGHGPIEIDPSINSNWTPTQPINLYTSGSGGEAAETTNQYNIKNLLQAGYRFYFYPGIESAGRPGCTEPGDAADSIRAEQGGNENLECQVYVQITDGTSYVSIEENLGNCNTSSIHMASDINFFYIPGVNDLNIYSTGDGWSTADLNSLNSGLDWNVYVKSYAQAGGASSGVEICVSELKYYYDLNTSDMDTNFTYAPNPIPDINSINTSQDVNFYDTTTSTYSDVNEWNWYINGQLLYTDQNITHTFTANGDYNVTLITRNEQNDIDREYKNMRIGQRYAMFTFTSTVTGIIKYAEADVNGNEYETFSGNLLQINIQTIPEGRTELRFNDTTDKNQTYQWINDWDNQDINELIFVESTLDGYIGVQVKTPGGVPLENVVLRIGKAHSTEGLFDLTNQILTNWDGEALIYVAEGASYRITTTKDGYTQNLPEDIETQEWLNQTNNIIIIMQSTAQQSQGTGYSTATNTPTRVGTLGETATIWTWTDQTRVHVYNVYVNGTLSLPLAQQNLAKTSYYDLNIAATDTNYLVQVTIDGNQIAVYLFYYDQNQYKVGTTTTSGLDPDTREGMKIAAFFIIIMLAAGVGAVTELGLPTLFILAIIANIIILPSISIGLLITGITGMIYFAADPVKKTVKDW